MKEKVVNVKKREIINYNNEEGRAQYENLSDEIAEEIKAVVSNNTISIDEVRVGINEIEERMQKKCFGTIWVGPKKKKVIKKRTQKTTDELFKD